MLEMSWKNHQMAIDILKNLEIDSIKDDLSAFSEIAIIMRKVQSKIAQNVLKIKRPRY